MPASYVQIEEEYESVASTPSSLTGRKASKASVPSGGAHGTFRF